MQPVAVVILILLSAGLAAVARAVVQDAVPKVRAALRGESMAPAAAAPAVSRAARSPASTPARAPSSPHGTTLPMRAAA